ncbi:unnamed protein product [Absidia cylindrospora]
MQKTIDTYLHHPMYHDHLSPLESNNDISTKDENSMLKAHVEQVEHTIGFYHQNEKGQQQQQEELQQKAASSPSFQVSYLAWVVIFCVVLLNTAVNLTWLSASSAPKSTSTWMQVSYSTLNWLSNVSAILNTIVSIPLPYSYERFGIKTNLVVAGIINMLGCWIRYLAILVAPQHRFLMVMMGQTLAAIAGPMVTNISTKLAAAWFPPRLRGISNTLTTLSIGPALAVLLIPRLAPTASSTPFMFLVISIFSTIIAIAMPFLPAQPKTPPSHSATQVRIGVFKSMKMLATQLDFWWLLILASTGFGMALCFSAVIMEAIIPFGYSEQQAGICVAVIIISGFAGGVTYPIPESVSNCIISAACSITTFLFTVLLDALRAGPQANPPYHMQYSLIAAASIVAIGSLPCLFLKGDMKRLAVDQLGQT